MKNLAFGGVFYYTLLAMNNVDKQERHAIARYNKKGVKLQPRILRDNENPQDVLEQMGYKEKGGVWKNSAGFIAEICTIDPQKRLAPARF